LFSDRTNWPACQNKLTQLTEDYRTSGKEFLNLTQSNPTQCNFSFSNSKLLQAFIHEDILKYDPSAEGMLEMRKAVAEYYKGKNIEVDPDDIFITASTSDAYQALFKLLANSGESILTSQVGYPLFEYLAQLNDVSLKKIDLNLNFDKEVVGRSDVKAVLIVNPNNPTGEYINSEQLEKLNEAACKKEIALISDEVFLDYPWDDNQSVISLAGNNQALTFTLSGISKVLGLPQMKLSWIVVSGPDKLKVQAKHRLSILLDTYLNVSTATQVAASRWLRNQPEITGEILSRVRQSRLFRKSFCELYRSPDSCRGRGLVSHN